MSFLPGDANHDRIINIDRYCRIDGQYPATNGFVRRDFNLDGKINIDDYGLIDGVIGTQGPVL